MSDGSRDSIDSNGALSFTKEEIEEWVASVGEPAIATSWQSEGEYDPASPSIDSRKTENHPEGSTRSEIEIHSFWTKGSAKVGPRIRSYFVCDSFSESRNFDSQGEGLGEKDILMRLAIKGNENALSQETEGVAQPGRRRIVLFDPSQEGAGDKAETVDEGTIYRAVATLVEPYTDTTERDEEAYTTGKKGPIEAERPAETKESTASLFDVACRRIDDPQNPNPILKSAIERSFANMLGQQNARLGKIYGTYYDKDSQ